MLLDFGLLGFVSDKYKRQAKLLLLIQLGGGRLQMMYPILLAEKCIQALYVLVLYLQLNKGCHLWLNS